MILLFLLFQIVSIILNCSLIFLIVSIIFNCFVNCFKYCIRLTFEIISLLYCSIKLHM